MKQLNPDQFQNLKEAYAQHEVDRMDLDDLMNLAWEYIVDSYKHYTPCLLYTSPSPRDQRGSRMPSSA